jgi:hypothetical protein
VVSEEESARFIPVNLIDQTPTAIEIVTPNGFTLKLAESNPRFNDESKDNPPSAETSENTDSNDGRKKREKTAAAEPNCLLILNVW